MSGSGGHAMAEDRSSPKPHGCLLVLTGWLIFTGGTLSKRRCGGRTAPNFQRKTGPLFALEVGR
jgi:hypothetical protein